MFRRLIPTPEKLGVGLLSNPRPRPTQCSHDPGSDTNHKPPQPGHGFFFGSGRNSRVVVGNRGLGARADASAADGTTRGADTGTATSPEAPAATSPAPNSQRRRIHSLNVTRSSNA